MMRDQFTERERARSALRSIDPGCAREEWVKAGMGAKAAGLDFDDFHNWSAGAGNYKDEAECRSVWRSIKEGSVTAASLFHTAKAAGWTDDVTVCTERPQSRQNERQLEQPSKRPLLDPATLWSECQPATAAHEYIGRKLGLPDGLRVYNGKPLSIAGQSCNGALVLPCYTLTGELASLQFVTEGSKPFLPGIKLAADGCLIVGGPIGDKPIYICEGVGQSWSAHQATGCPAAVCFGAARMAKVAEAIHAKHPSARLVIVSDGGKEQQAEAIARKVSGSWCEMPAGSPSNYDLNDFHQAHGLKAVRSLLEQAKQPPQRFRLLTPSDLASLPPVQWRVRGVLPYEGIGAMFGPSGSGKSFLTLDLLATVASGGEWFGCRVKPAPVLYIALEGEAGISQRVKAYEMKHGPVSPSFRFMLQGVDIRNAGDRADLVQAVKAIGWNGGVVCLDTLNRASPGMDENDSKSMGEVISAAKALQAELGGLVLLIHHSGKDQSKGMRGHSSLHAALDCAVEVCRDGDRREWKMHKAKDGEDGEARPFRLDVVEVGSDDEGEPITSCVVAPEESTGNAVRRALPPKSGNQRIIWDALGGLFRAAGSYAPEGAPKELPPGRPCLLLDAAIDGTRSRLVCDPKRQTERTQAAITGLINRGLLELREGWLWCA